MILELRNIPIDKQEEMKAFYNSSLENGNLETCIYEKSTNQDTKETSTAGESE